MCVFRYSFIVFILFILKFSKEIILDLELGDPCLEGLAGEGTCMEPGYCGNSTLLRTLDICNFNGIVPIVCCPRRSKANESCEERCRGYLRKKRNAEEPDAPVEHDERVWHNFSTDGIQGGQEVAFYGDNPYMVVIGFGQDPDIEWNCGGTFLSNRFVLSAAHCSHSTMGPPTYVRMGVLDITSSPKEGDFKIVERIVHPGYREPAMYNDIALFKLEEKQTPQIVSPVCLFSSNNLPKKGIASGWGRTHFVGGRSQRLLQVELEVFSDAECLRMLSDLSTSKVPRGYNTTTMICAGDRKGGKDTCTGDSGGPLTFVPDPMACRHYQMGVTSFGRGCGRADSPGVYTRVSYYIPWIESYVWP